ncbi:hypothetical protein CW731_12840 [Polaribacter sp. ALD11]|uniref:outer membrane beta-barrel family protein n=1 Tax=Polaribacter sp. ALD11 TaxID=2058137 RepID=UPI000C2FF67A|nr:outer membrane beta-barrel family protein [Polaribacter sp. ALD11]AUC86113.1 hypothetical protein CW731_12840 [Polaribacter sp. ALD11]
MKNLIVTIVFTLCLSFINAQEITINGKITSKETNEVLPYTAVATFNATTNKYINYGYTDENGFYSISLTKTDFYLKAELLGYESFKSEVIQYSKNTITRNIVLKEDASELDEIVILSKKRLIRMTGDKMIVDIDKSGLGNGNDGLETLSKLPGMQLDKDENIVFRGNANLQIMIDGKPALLKGDELKQFLKTLDGSNIKTVEIIANPSAKYDASGTGGILNIRLKKSPNTGLTGNIYSSVGYAEFIKNRNGINLYNNTQKWNMNAGLYYGYNESVNHRKIIQTIKEPNQTTVLEQLNDWFPKGDSYTAKFGVSNKISENVNIGTSWNYNIYKSDELTEGRTNQFYNDIYKRYTLLNTTQLGKNKTITGNVYYSFVSDSLDTKLDIQLNYANYNNTEDRLTTNTYLNTDENSSFKEQEAIKNSNPTTYNIFSTKIDFEKKLSTYINLETGLKYSYVDNNYNIILKNRDLNGDFIIDTNRSNHLLYKESITAGYAIANFSTQKWNFQTGLRAEYINYEATSATTNTSNADNYLSFFPSFSVNGNFDANQYKFSYSKRIQRPRYLYLNPFFEYIDTYNVSVGNPNLKPEFTNAFEVTWVRKYKTALSLFANFTNSGIFYIIDYDENTQITTTYYDNIGKSTNIGTSFNTSIEFTKWWEIVLYADLSYNQAKSEIENYQFNDSSLSWNGSINQLFTFKDHLSLNWNSFYSSGGTYGNSISKPSYDMSFGLKKELFNKKLRVNLKADNVLKKSMYRSVTTQDNISTNWTNQWETRKFTLSLTYNFGSGKEKSVRNTDLQDEKSRL